MRGLLMKRREWGLVFPLLFAVAGCGPHGDEPAADKAEEEGEAHVTVRAVKARIAPLIETVEALGRCEPLPDQIATLTPAVEGHVHELLARQGDAVKKGQPIVELDKSAASADLAEKTATRDGLKASLNLLKSIPRSEERRANELAIEQARVAVAQAKEAVDRLKPLRDRHEVSEQQLFIAQTALEQAQIQQKTAEAQLAVMLIGPRPEAVAEAEGKIKTADALVAFSQAHLDFHTIRSPIDGVLDSLTCHPGQTIAIGSPIGEVVDTRRVFASVWLAPRAAVLVKMGMPATVQLAEERALASESAEKPEPLKGTIAFVGRVADVQTGNLPVRILVDNLGGRLTVGQAVAVTITVSERKDVLQVPSQAVLDLGEGPVLGVVREGKSAVLHPELRTPHDGWVELAGAELKDGDLVIVEGGYNLPEGTPVKLAADEPEKKDEKDEAHGEKPEVKDAKTEGHDAKAEVKKEEGR